MTDAFTDFSRPATKVADCMAVVGCLPGVDLPPAIQVMYSPVPSASRPGLSFKREYFHSFAESVPFVQSLVFSGFSVSIRSLS